MYFFPYFCNYFSILLFQIVWLLFLWFRLLRDAFKCPLQCLI